MLHEQGATGLLRPWNSLDKRLICAKDFQARLVKGTMSPWHVTCNVGFCPSVLSSKGAACMIRAVKPKQRNVQTTNL